MTIIEIDLPRLESVRLENGVFKGDCTLKRREKDTIPYNYKNSLIMQGTNFFE